MDAQTVRERLDVDVRILHVEPTVAFQSFQRYLRRLPPDIFVGDLAQLQRYHAWRYRPEQSMQDPNLPSPLRGAKAIADIDSFVFPDFGGEHAYHRLRSQIQDYHHRQLAVFAMPPRLGGVLFEPAWRLRGFEKFMCDLVRGNAVTMWLLDRLTDLACHHAALTAAAEPDVLYFGDDFGEPTRLMLSPQMWQRIFAPRYQRIVDAARAAKPDIHLCFHSDGNFTGLIEHLIAVGIDAIEPVQPDCMDPLSIKRRFDRRVTLVGCAGTAELFHHGSPDQIRREVRRRIDQLGINGLILAPSYDLMSCTPWANVEAFFDEARR
jgi:uroporphyrinogen decarboxylase